MAKNSEHNSTAHLSRRHFLGLCGSLLGGLYLFGYQKAEAKVAQRPPLDLELAFNIPKAWVKLEGENALLYAQFIDALGLKHITPAMVLKPHFKVRNGVRQGLPPRHLWKNIRPTLELIDLLTTRLGVKPPEILSAYRSPRFIKAIKGSLKSSHSQNIAVDVKFTASPWKVAKEARRLRSIGFFKGGVGRNKTFVHIDTRGYNVDW